MTTVSIDVKEMAAVLERLRIKSDWAKKVADVLSSKDSPVRKLSEARRGNTAAPNVEGNVDKVFAATISEEIKRTKASVKRFSS